jgi:hypothetical protein
MWRIKSRAGEACVLVVLLMALAAALTGEAAAQGREPLHVGRYGADLPAGFTVTALVDDTEPCPNAEATDATEVVKLSVNKEIAVLTSQFFYAALPVYRKPETRDFRLIDYDDKGNYLVWRVIETWRLSTPEGDQALKLYRLFRVSPEGKVLPEQSVHTQLLKSRSTARSGVSDFDLIVMALGQGFSRYLGRPVVEKDASGPVRFRAAGGLAAGSEGIWELTYAAEKERLVREAAFSGKNGYSSLTVRTSGIAEAKGAALAREGEIRLGDPIQPYGFTVELKTFAARADAKLIKAVRERFAAPLKKGDEILDTTGEVTEREFVDDTDPVQVAKPCCVCQPVNRTFSECGHLQASVRCASEWCITNVMTSATCANVAPSGVASCPIVSPVPIQPEVIQTPSLLANGGCPTGGNLVVYATLFTTYDGCDGCTPSFGTNHQTACDVAACPAGMSLDRCAVPRGIRRACA